MSDLDRQQQRSSSTSGDAPMGNGILEIPISTPRGDIEMDGYNEQGVAEAAADRRRSGMELAGTAGDRLRSVLLV